MKKKKRSYYSIQFNCDPNMVNHLVQSYLQTNGYTFMTKQDESFYRSGDPFIHGYTFFAYQIVGQTVNISAWLPGAFGGERDLEGKNLQIPVVNYRNSLSTLFQAISDLSNSCNNPNEQNQQPQASQPNPNQFTQAFKNDNLKRKEGLCEAGFWISLLGLLLSFMGGVYSLFIYIFSFYFASQGLSTRKRGKAIATIVISIVSIFVLICWFLASYFIYY